LLYFLTGCFANELKQEQSGYVATSSDFIEWKSTKQRGRGKHIFKQLSGIPTEEPGIK
jgi:hypothetical protein